MNDINILVTGGGSPGIAGTIYSLRNNFDNRQFTIICTDAKKEFPGIYLADKNYQIPMAREGEKYIQELIKICTKEKIDIILPQNTAELEILARNKKIFQRIGTVITISESNSLEIANNKHELLKECRKLKIPVPEFFVINNRDGLINSAKNLGWPQKPVVIKPPDSNGSRGMRIIDENVDFRKLFYEEKPTGIYTRMDDILKILGDTFEPLLIMEFLHGEEVTVDVLRVPEKFIAIPRIREEIKSGISFKNSAEKREDLINYSKIISDSLNLKYCFGFQFKYDYNGIPKILECNPRVQGTMIFSIFMGANLIYAAVKSSLGESLPEFKLNWETKLIRYWGAIGINDDLIQRV